jgi:hypothetical protein
MKEKKKNEDPDLEPDPVWDPDPKNKVTKQNLDPYL